MTKNEMTKLTAKVMTKVAVNRKVARLLAAEKTYQCGRCLIYKTVDRMEVVAVTKSHTHKCIACF